MRDHRPNPEKEEEDIVETLLKLPAKNLESRIRQLEQDIQERKKLRNHTLSTFGTHKLQLKDQIDKLNYFSLLSNGFKVRQDLGRQIIGLEELIIAEMTACFRDIVEFNEKLQLAREELVLAREKLRLIESDTDQENQS